MRTPWLLSLSGAQMNALKAGGRTYLHPWSVGGPPNEAFQGRTPTGRRVWLHETGRIRGDGWREVRRAPRMHTEGGEG